jgi:hypothetical protein
LDRQETRPKSVDHLLPIRVKICGEPTHCGHLADQDLSRCAWLITSQRVQFTNRSMVEGITEIQVTMFGSDHYDITLKQSDQCAISDCALISGI